MRLTRRSLLASASAFALLPVLCAKAQEPVPGGTLVVAADTEPRNLNPAIVASNGVFFVASKVVEPLAEMDAGTGLRPLLATSWEGSDDGLSFTLKLREGVKFHDGEAFTSDDVAFSAMEVWKKLQNLGQVVFADLAAVDTPDAHTAVMRFTRPTPAQLIENALPALTAVLPAHLYEGSDIATNPKNLAPVGTGPFTFAEHRPGEFYRLAKNPAYWGEGQPYLDEIVFRVLPDAATKAAALEAGEIDLVAFSAVPLADLERLAAVEGIDAAFIAEVVVLGHATPATGLVPTTAATFYTDDVATYPFDVARAESLLDAAGFPRKADGTRFALRLRPAPWFNETRAVGDVVAQALASIGIVAEIVTADPASHTAAVYTTHDFDLAIGSPVYRNDPAISTTVLYQSGLPAGVPFSNQYGYASTAMDGLIAAGASELDKTARANVYKDMQRLAAEDLPVLPLVEFTFLTVARDTVKNVGNNPRWATSGWADVFIEP